MEYIATKTKTKEVMDKYGTFFKKKFGQNFLIDKNIIEKIISSANVTKDDIVIEVGPGIGNMTQYLCSAAKKVIAVEIDKERPVLVDHYIQGKEVEVDAICDGIDVFVPGIMELVERTGVHSGDSISVYPTFSVSNKAKGKILEYKTDFASLK